MAKNLRAKIPKEDTLYINDVNQASMEAFQKEIASGTNVKIASSPREVAENAVSNTSATTYAFYDEILSYL